MTSASRLAWIIASAIAMVAGPAAAQQYPSQPLNIVVAAAAGGFADGVARAIGERLGSRLGQSVIIDNRAGAAGNLGARAVAAAKPDGHTILVSTTAMAINGTLYKNMGYQTSDITPVAIVGSAPEAIVAHPNHPANNIGEFIKSARDKGVEYGSAGVGSGSFIAAEYLFKVLAKNQSIVHVPFPGGAPAITALLGGHVAAVAATVTPLIPHITSGKLKGLGIASPQRFSVVSNVPTFAESGYPNFYAASWVGFFLPAKTDAAVVAKLNAAINETLKEGEVRERMVKFGLEPRHGNHADTVKYFGSEVANWGKMVKALNLSIN